VISFVGLPLFKIFGLHLDNLTYVDLSEIKNETMRTVLTFLSVLVALMSFAQGINIPVDTTITTQHMTTINGQKLAYTAVTGTQPLWDEAGEPIATLHYTYYRRSDTKDFSKRPLLISFNGGPGSASAWMHIAYTGPKLLNIDDEGYPVQPYGIKDNPFSVLDVSDILYINPVNTGYSRTIPVSGKEVKREKFFGINADITYLAEWLNTFMSRNNRWLSPKYLIGESYGGTRVSGLALELQEKQWMYLNGVILVSPADYNVFESDAPISSSLNLPYFSAAAWYHKMLPLELQGKTLNELLPEVEKYTLDVLMPALARGASLNEKEKEVIAEKMAYYSGLTKKSILQHNLVVPTSFFWKELLRDRDGYSVGRLDSRYLGLDKMEAGGSPDYNPELTSWLHSFTPAINFYMSEVLNFKTDMKYNMFGSVHPWDRQNNNTRDNLRKAMAQNPYLNVMFQVGYFDGATTYFNSKYTMWQIDPSGKMSDRMYFEGYESGHMMYLRKEDLKSANDHVRKFILDATIDGKPAKY
jgi:carboxypeptidase C (cathepsin A)